MAVKAVFDIKTDGDLVLASEQIEPSLLPEYNGEAGLSSLRYDADLVSPKPCTDVIVNGTAYAPKGRPTQTFSVALRIGRLYKELKVIGNRTWQRGIASVVPSSIEAVRQIPIVYERAYGGHDRSDPDPAYQRMDARNPVGCGLVTVAGSPLPNVVYPSGKIEDSGPAGFGALASYWTPRREFVGTYDQAWQQRRSPLLPLDWDPRSLLCSPLDQQTNDHLHGGESVELTNLTPSGRLQIVVPKVQLTFRTAFSRGSAERVREHQGRLSTVIIEPDVPRVILVWLTALSCPSDADYLDTTCVSEMRQIA